MNNLIEKKVAYGAGAGGIVTLILGLAATYHWFTPPPPYLTALGVSLLSGLVGYLAPHTSLPGDGQPAPLVSTDHEAVHAVDDLRRDLARWLSDHSRAHDAKPAAQVQVQPSATSTAAPVAASVSISDPAPASYPYPQPPATGGTKS